MKIKIGNKIYDSDKEPITIILTDKEKKQINENVIKTEAHKDSSYWTDNNYRIFPYENIKKWMDEI